MWPNRVSNPGLLTYKSGALSAALHLGWSGGAMVLGKLPVPAHPTIWISVGQGPLVLAVGAGGVVWTFYSRLSFLLSFSLSQGECPI